MLSSINTSSNVSQTQKEADSKLNVVASRQREAMRPTQPVRLAILKRINEHDAMAEKNLDSHQADTFLHASTGQSYVNFNAKIRVKPT